MNGDKLIQVTWIDSSLTGAGLEFSAEEAADIKPTKITSIGHRVIETPDYITLATDRIEHPEGVTFRGIVSIPRCSICLVKLP